MPEQEAMTFDRRLQTAITTGWRTLLLGVGVVALQWMAYLALTSARPSWFLAIWGPDVTWAQVQSIWLVAMVALKVGLFAFALILVWATWFRAATRTSASSNRVAASIGAAG